MTTTEILADLATDEELSGTIANLEATYLQQLDTASDVDALLSYRVARVRDALALATLAIEQLIACR